jgi:hypothetical protein
VQVPILPRRKPEHGAQNAEIQNQKNQRFLYEPPHLHGDFTFLWDQN